MLLQEIIEKFGIEKEANRRTIPKCEVLNWMQSDDIEILGAVYSFLSKSQYALKIAPALTFTDYAGFMTHYFERCFHEDPDGEWSDSRYAAARGLVSWFNVLWNDKNIDRKELVGLKNWLASVYRSADEPLRRCIVNGALEHLFENLEIADFFADWNNDPVLASAYAGANKWSAN